MGFFAVLFGVKEESLYIILLLLFSLLMMDPVASLAVQKFLYCALKLYMGEVGKVDFHNAPEEARKLINLWVEIQSHGKSILSTSCFYLMICKTLTGSSTIFALWWGALETLNSQLNLSWIG